MHHQRPGAGGAAAQDIHTASKLCDNRYPSRLGPAEQQKVDGLIKQMTLAQKLDYIGGTGFAVRGVPSLSIPPLEILDGPYGTR